MPHLPRGRRNLGPGRRRAQERAGGPQLEAQLLGLPAGTRGSRAPTAQEAPRGAHVALGVPQWELGRGNGAVEGLVRQQRYGCRRVIVLLLSCLPLCKERFSRLDMKVSINIIIAPSTTTI